MRKLFALFDSLADAAPRDSTLSLHGDEEARALVAWSAANRHPVSERRASNSTHAWTVFSVALPNGAKVDAFSFSEQVEQAVDHG